MKVSLKLWLCMLAILGAAAPGCDQRRSAPAFRFAVAEVWPMQISEDVIAEDSALAVGEVTDGTIRVGDRAIVRGADGDITVMVEKIRAGEDGELDAKEASKGETVALNLRGISPDAEWASDELMGKAISGDRSLFKSSRERAI